MRARGVWASLTIALVGVLGCSLNSAGVGGGDGGHLSTESDGTASSGSTTVEGASGPPSSSTTSAGTGSAQGTASSDPTGQGTGGDGGVSTGTTTLDSGTTGPKTDPASCAEILAANPNSESGTYQIAPPKSQIPVPFDVFCDMHTAEGGWTLVGRSVAGVDDPGQFGWNAATGSIGDTAKPYSLDAVSAGLVFTQLLVGNHGDGMNWGDRVYQLDVPGDLLAHTDDDVSTSNITTVAGSCNPSGGPDMLTHVGFTAKADWFYFRDQSGDYDVGLTYDNWNMYWNVFNVCSKGADLDGDEGMIFVR